MTKTALANREMRSREFIASEDRRSREGIAAKDRASKEDIAAKQREHEAREGRRDRTQRYVTESLKAVGTAVKGVKFNDPAFYKQYVKNLDTFFNVPTFDRLGKLSFQDLIADEDATTKRNFALSGIMVFPWIPTVGPQPSVVSFGSNPINQILARSKEKILALNSRSSVNWEFSDLGYNIICSSDIMSMIQDLGRVIKVYQTYHASNAYLAKTLIEALGWSYSDIVANHAEYRKTYTIYAKRFNSAIVAPASVTLYARRAYLAVNVFCDSHDPNYPRQLYAFRQSYAYRLSDTGESCDMIECSTARANLAAFKTVMDSMFSAIVENPDFVEMYQDLRHAFGSDIIQLSECVDTESIQFNSVELNRLQIHNLKTLPALYDRASTVTHTSLINVTEWVIEQDASGYLYQGNDGVTPGTRKVYITADTNVSSNELQRHINKYIGPTAPSLYNVYEEKVSGDTILDITRSDYKIRSAMPLDGATSMSFDIMDCGTEVFEGIRIFTIYHDNALNSDGVTIDFYSSLLAVEGANWPATVLFNEVNGFMSHFDWHPICHTRVFGLSSSGAAPYTTATIFDSYTTFVIQKQTMYDLHCACVLSEFFIPDRQFSR